MILQIKKNKALRFLVIVIMSTIVSVIFHQIHNDPLMNLAGKTQSFLITSGMFPPVAFSSLAATFAIIGLIFLGIQKSMQGSKSKKGIFFGIAISGIWIIGMIEAHVLFSLSLFGEIYTGFADSIGIFTMCYFLGKNFADDTLIDTPLKKDTPKTSYLAVPIITIMYILVRYFSYSILGIESAYIGNPVATFIWTLSMGGWIGIVYARMSLDMYRSPLKNALLLGGIIFGVVWIIFNLFAVLFIIVPVSDLILRSGFDMLAVILGVYFFSLFHTGKVCPAK